MHTQGIGPREVTADRVKLYKWALAEAGLRAGTVARRLSVLRGAYCQLASTYKRQTPIGTVASVKSSNLTIEVTSK
jgi:hypothetical protein